MEKRNDAIIKAALDQFTRNGFAGTRMDEIAKRAGVAKGTLYLYFRNKQALFEAIIRQEISPLVEAAENAPGANGSVRDIMEQTILRLVTGPGRQRRGAVIRLLVGEAGRFPKLAETYFRTVIQPGIAVFRGLTERAWQQGELKNRIALEFPQLIFAPAIVAMLWIELFSRLQPLDVEAMLQAHFDQLFQPRAKPKPRPRQST